jgi:hypothetical protein
MGRRHLAFVVLGMLPLIAHAAAPSQAARQADIPASCPVTIPATTGFVPPQPYPAAAPFPRTGWIGTADLWTMVATDGRYHGLHVPTGYRQKLFWWRAGYDGRLEPRPALALTATHLDPPTPSLQVRDATNAFADDLGGWTMLVMPDLPDSGCWRLTGEYGGTSLSYVVWVDR